MQTRNEERHMVFVNDICEKKEVGLRSHITSTKQVCENKQSSVEVHSVVWPRVNLMCELWNTREDENNRM